jgi:Mg2+ and Co2+ transporter CorA
MRYRIRRTCHGHLTWLYKHALQNTLSSHYWASGKEIKPSVSARISENWNMDILKNSIVDTPFHIIKAADFFQIISDDDIQNEFIVEYKEIFGRWTSLLHLDNKYKEYVFPHSKDTTIQEFYFSEQAIIWRAIKSGEAFGLDSAINMQHSVLNKFSCESLVSDKPMIATSRSVYGNTFELDIQDTAIFYAVEHGIFTTSEHPAIGQHKLESWMNTLDHQVESDGSLDSSWNDLPQAALALMTSVKSRDMEPESMKRRHKSAKSALLRSSSPNGLLLGRSREDQELVFKKDHFEYHSYWHAVFELPYILWMYGEYSPLADGSIDDTLATEASASSNKSYNGKKQITSYTKKERIVKYPNKWLYTKPRFLTLEVDLGMLVAESFFEKNKSKDKSRDTDIVIKKAFEKRREHSKASTTLNGSFSVSRKGYIVDIPEFAGSNRAENSRPNYIYSALNLRLQLDPHVLSELWTYNGNPSENNSLPTPANKRLMHFHEMDFELAIACYQASSEAENLSRFFDRHATYDKYFYEDTQLVFNRWTTELHLSFYQIIPGNLTVSRDLISELKKIPFPSFKNDNEPQSINRVSMSLKFDGDIFDSSWVCHFIEFNPQQIEKKTTVQLLTENNTDDVAEENSWQERRVLELLMFDKMLDEILQSSKDVLQQIKQSIVKNSKSRAEQSSTNQHETDYDMAMLLAEFKIFDKTPADVFLSIRSAWHQFQRFTDIVEEDLRENIDTIDLWINREEKRHDKPQWLESSEQKYGWKISQLLAKNNRKVDELKRCYDSIKVFNASLTKRMEVASSKWEIQSSNDIRLFTYVTVVFLPISFATSIFSMSDSPSGSLIRHMVVVAAVALGATILALFNAKVLDSKIVRPLYNNCQFITNVWIYFIARYIYYPARSEFFHRPQRQQSSEHSGDTRFVAGEEPAYSPVCKRFAEKRRKLLERFDDPRLKARKDFDKAMQLREPHEAETSGYEASSNMENAWHRVSDLGNALTIR